jgi:hypothetical protein
MESEKVDRAKLTINMNARVGVRLTETGLRILDEWEEALGLPEKHRRINVTDGDRWRGELWALLQQFGERITMGMPIPFVDNRVDVLDERGEPVSRPPVALLPPETLTEEERRRLEWEMSDDDDAPDGPSTELVAKLLRIHDRLWARVGQMEKEMQDEAWERSERD